MGIRAMFAAPRLLGAILAALVVTAGLPAVAQTYPERPIRLIVPFPAGGPMDVMARLVGQQMTQRLGQTVVVENRGGAGGAIGSKAVVLAEPDGYTLLWGSSGTLAVLPALNRKLDYDSRAFVPIALVALLPQVFVVPPDVPAKTVREFIDHAKRNPGKLNFGASLGTPPHLLGALFKTVAGIDIVYIPYKGSASSLTDMLGGQTQMTFDALTTLYPVIQEGKLRPLAVTSARRWPLLPNVPTMIESGFPDFPQNAWAGVLAPPGTPAIIVQRLNGVINDGLHAPEADANLARLSALAQPGSPQDFAAFIAEQSPKWAEMVELSGATIE
jgi:tripartite-type tricarboxylate transporter receptor subunit TctC